MTLSDPPSIEDDVIEVLKRMSRQPIEPSPSSDLVVDLGFDSFQILEVIAALEDRFDISIPRMTCRRPEPWRRYAPR